MIAYKVVKKSGDKLYSVVIRENSYLHKRVEYIPNKKVTCPLPLEPLFCYEKKEDAEWFLKDKSTEYWLKDGETLLLYECEVKVHPNPPVELIQLSSLIGMIIFAEEVTLKKAL